MEDHHSATSTTSQDVAEYMGVHPCNICPLTFIKKSYQYHHEEHAHGIIHEYFSCIFCNASNFVSKGMVVEHMWVAHKRQTNYMWDMISLQNEALPTAQVSARIRSRLGRMREDADAGREFACRWTGCNFVADTGEELVMHVVEELRKRTHWEGDEGSWACRWEDCLTELEISDYTTPLSQPAAGGENGSASEVGEVIDEEASKSTPTVSKSTSAFGKEETQSTSPAVAAQTNTTSDVRTKTTSDTRTNTTSDTQTHTTSDTQTNPSTHPPHLPTTSAQRPTPSPSPALKAFQQSISAHFQQHIPVRCPACYFIFPHHTAFTKHRCHLKPKQMKPVKSEDIDSEDENDERTIVARSSALQRYAQIRKARLARTTIPGGGGGLVSKEWQGPLMRLDGEPVTLYNLDGPLESRHRKRRSSTVLDTLRRAMHIGRAREVAQEG